MKHKRLGIGFIDEVSKVTLNNGHFKQGKEKLWQDNLLPNFSPEYTFLTKDHWRLVVLSALTLLTFFLIFLRLFHLQVVRGSEHRQMADGNRIQVKAIHAPRGVIFDRNGKILAQNNPGFRLVDKTKQPIRHRYITRDQSLEMEIRGDPALQDLEIDSLRVYPLKEKTAHILGYVSEITAEELELPKFKGKYKAGDKIGRGGLEEAYEEVLRGKDGGEVIEVDSQGIKVRTLRKTDPTPGQNIYLAIDSELQSFVYDKLSDQIKKVGSCCGGAIGQDPNSGSVLFLVSIPSFDPNNIADAITSANSPILNRVISGTYPPGSTFKIASSLAGLASGKITPATVFEDTGVMNLGPFKFANWYFTQYGKTEGLVDMVKALKRSNDIYFYRLGELIGEEQLGQTAKKLGIGGTLGIDLPGEATGLIPNNEWKEKNYNQSWYPGDTLHMSIGQGFLLTTPIQVNNLTNIIASNGYIQTPHLALRSTNPDGSGSKDFEFKESRANIKQADINLVRKGLEEVPQAGGTAWPFFTFPLKTAGKTGTAEFGDPKDKTHAWYTAYAPTDDPRITATVLIEAGGEGSTDASPVVKEIFRWFLSEDKRELIKDLGIVATDSARTLGE
jgi:penicillin-binding protein 2